MKDEETNANSIDSWEVVPESAGQRLDLALCDRHPELSRTRIQNAIREGAVFVDGQPADTLSMRLSAGRRIDFHLPPVSREEDMVPQPDASIPMEILFEDESLLVVNKPAGLVVHPGTRNLQGTLVSALLARDPDNFNDMMDEECRPGIVHRLDKDTSGCLAIAKTQAAAEALRTAFRERQTTKIYLAVARGYFDPPSGTIDAPIARDELNRVRMAVVPVEAGGKEALTKYRVVAAFGGCSLLQVRLYTGRTHQIRVHLAWMRRPVLGDLLYGGGRDCPPFSVQRQMLHAWKLALPHPVTGQPMTFTAPMPPDFRETVERFTEAAPASLKALFAEDRP